MTKCKTCDKILHVEREIFEQNETCDDCFKSKQLKDATIEIAKVIEKYHLKDSEIFQIITLLNKNLDEFKNMKIKIKSIDWEEVKKYHEMYTQGSGKGPHGYPDPPRIYELLLDLNKRLEKVETIIDRFAGGKEWRKRP